MPSGKGWGRVKPRRGSYAQKRRNEAKISLYALITVPMKKATISLDPEGKEHKAEVALGWWEGKEEGGHPNALPRI